MWTISPRTYRWLTTSLNALGLTLFFGSLLAIRTDWLETADFCIRFAIFPGGLIAGALVLLINGCVEHYADILSPDRPEARDRVAAGIGRADAKAATARPRPGSTRIDRQARDRLAVAIRRYMDEVLAAFAFDEEISGIRASTGDATVHFVADSLWFHYDDCKDHLAGLSRPEWDYFQRLLLLLESDARIEHLYERRWSPRQIVAGVAVIAFGLCIFRYGIGWHLSGFAVLFGPMSILLAYWPPPSAGSDAGEAVRLAPFSSISELRAVRKAVSGFTKRRYPAGSMIRKVHSRFVLMAAWLHTAVLWSFVSPVVLLFQALPAKEIHTRIRHGGA